MAAEVLCFGWFLFLFFWFCLGILYRFKLDMLLFLSAKSGMQVNSCLGFQIKEFPVTFDSCLTGFYSNSNVHFYILIDIFRCSSQELFSKYSFYDKIHCIFFSVVFGRTSHLLRKLPRDG